MRMIMENENVNCLKFFFVEMKELQAEIEILHEREKL